MRGSREDMSGDRRGRWRIIGAVAAVAVAGAGLGACTDDGAETVEASPSVLADTAADIRSGRIEMSMGPATSVMQFDGDDMRMTTELSDEVDTGTNAPTDDGDDESVTSSVTTSPSMVTVDGITYMQFDERWQKMPDLDLDAAAGGDAAPTTSTETAPSTEPTGPGGFAAAVSTALARSTVDEPGERIERDGDELVRYRTSLSGDEAEELLDEVMGGTWTSGNDESRQGRIVAYLQSHTTMEIVGEVDDLGGLRRLEVVQTSDTSAYPDCGLYSDDLFGALTDISMVFTEINEPQDIQAPPAELVDEFEVPSPLDLGIVNGDLPDELLQDLPPELQAELDAAMDGPQLDVEPDAAAESLQTSTGPRTRSEILDYLRRWAEGAGIDWRTIPLPDDAGMVALFDARYADDVTGRGPELVTTLGPYPRGYLVEVVRELDPSVDAASLDDAALVAAYEGLRGVGDVPSTSDRADDMTTDSTVVSSDDVDDDSEGSYFDGESEDEYLEGCPD